VPELDWEGMPKHQAIKADWRTPEILIEGSLNCAKTTLWLDKEVDALLKWPGIKSLLFRWSQDAVDTKLRPAFEELLSIRGIASTWDNKAHHYTLDNGSIAYMFGIKAVSMVEQMNKIRGLGVSRASGDQIEEVAPAVAGELRGRLRPDLTATTIQKQSFPFQLIFVSNSEDDDFWISKEFPLDNHIKGRKVFQLSVFDNKHLPQESVDSLLRQYPEDHPKHRTMVLGQRGPRVYGVAVFEGLYRKDLHWRPIAINPAMPILESFQCGKHNPAWVCAQAMLEGGLAVHGAILGLGMVLEDFLPLVERCREDWLPKGIPIRTSASPMGGGTTAPMRYTLLNILRQRWHLAPHVRDDANAPDVRVATIENLASYMRRRNSGGAEAFAVSNIESHFLIANKEGQRFSPIVHHACEGGYTWDEHFVSVGNKEVKQPREDDKFANIMHCIENIELNFCAGKKTKAEKDQELAKQRGAERRRTFNPWG
jgi:hypothetical protein